jgi:hypothetical protein
MYDREVPLHEVVEMCESWVGILQSAPTLQPIQLSTTSPTTEMGDEPKGKELQGYLHPLTRAFVETLEGFISRLKSAESASTSVPASGYPSAFLLAQFSLTAFNSENQRLVLRI